MILVSQAFFILVLCPPAFVLEYFRLWYVSRIFRWL